MVSTTGRKVGSSGVSSGGQRTSGCRARQSRCAAAWRRRSSVRSMILPVCWIICHSSLRFIAVSLNQRLSQKPDYYGARLKNICSNRNIQHPFENVKRKSKLCLIIPHPLPLGHCPASSGLRPSPPDRGSRPLEGKAKNADPKAFPFRGRWRGPKGRDG